MSIQPKSAAKTDLIILRVSAEEKASIQRAARAYITGATGRAGEHDESVASYLLGLHRRQSTPRLVTHDGPEIIF